MYRFRAFKFADLGTKIIPILYSFFEIGGMLVITLFTSLAFVHAFLAVDNRPLDESTNVVLGTFKLLLVGGDDGVDTILGLGREGGTATWFTSFCFIISTFIYGICLMNIFIAVLYEGYRKAHKDALPSFLQERARICLQCLLLPPWPRRWGKLASRPRACCAVLAAVTLPVWFGLLLSQIHPLVPSVLLFLTVLICDVLLVQRPGDGSHRDRNFLWWCAREKTS